jgi:hypothetical protein
MIFLDFKMDLIRIQFWSLNSNEYNQIKYAYLQALKIPKLPKNYLNSKYEKTTK